MKISLLKHVKCWIEGRIKSGKYHNASEYIRGLIHQDQTERQKHEALKSAIAKGRESGIDPRTIDQILSDAKAKSCKS